MVVNLPANAGDTGLIPDPGRSPGEGSANPFQYSSWKIPGTEEPSGLQSTESQRVRYDLATEQQQQNHVRTAFLAISVGLMVDYCIEC